MQRLLTSVAPSLACVLMAAHSAAGAVLMQQDFSSSEVVTDYESGTPGVGQFNDISPTGTTVPETTTAIVDENLVFADGSTPYGLYRDGLDTGSGLLAVTMTFSVSDSTNQPLFRIQVGDFGGHSMVTDYSNQLTSLRFDDFLFRGQSTSYQIETAGGNITGLNFDEQYTLTYLLNRSGSTETYVGPDGASHDLANNSVAIFIDGTLSEEYSAPSPSDVPNTFRIHSTWNSNSDLAIDAIEIRDTLAIPEPSSLGLFMGSLVLLRRRRSGGGQ